MGFLPLENRPIAHRQNDPLAVPSGTGIDGTLIIATDQASAAPTLALDTSTPAGGGFTVAPPLVSNHTPVLTITPSGTPTPTPSSDSADPSASVAASSSSSRAISMSTVVGSCVGAFIGAVALIGLGLWFYRRYHRSLKATYGSRSRGPVNARADMQRRLSHREHWGKLEDSNPEDKWEGRVKQSSAESVPPMEKLTMFNRAVSVRTGYTHTDEEPVHLEMPHPFAQQYPLQNRTHANHDHHQNNQISNASMPTPKPFIGRDTNPSVLSWDDTAQGSFLSVRTTSERLSGAMSPSLNMAIPTPPATSSPLHHWESAEIINFDGQSAEIVNPFSDENRPEERRKSAGNPFFGAQEDPPRPRSRSNSLASKASRAQSDASSTHIPVPKIDKGKGRAIDPFDDDHATAPLPNPSTRPLPTITTPVPTTTTTANSPSSPLPPPRPQFATHVSSLSASSSSSNERAMASLLAALDGETTQEEVQARLRIASMQPSINSTTSVYSEMEGEEDVTKEFPLPPSTPGHSTPTVESYKTAESDRTARA